MPFQAQYSSHELPPWLNNAYMWLEERARAMSHEGYKPYGGQRVASVPKEITDATNIANREVGGYKPYLDTGQRILEEANARLPEQVDDYMNPYITHVTDKIANLGNRNFRENLLPALEQQFIRAGGHGGDKHREYANRLTRDIQEGITREQQQALAGGFNQAGQFFNQDQNRKMQVGREMASLSPVYQGAVAHDINALNQQGALKQQRDQTLLDNSYNDFLKQTNNQRDKLGELSNILHGIPYQSQSMSYTQTPGAPQVNTMGQLGSLAGNIYGMRMLAGRKKGGRITKNVRGGY